MRITINNKEYEIRDTKDEIRLIDLLRNELKLTGTKRGCDIGLCGTCTVLVNGQIKRACKLRLKQLKEEDSILTIEGLAEGNELHPIQEAFIKADAIQCGFCTPGMVLATKALLDKSPKPSREEIKKALQGNLCRCTGYQQIFEAVELAAKKMRCRGRRTPAAS
ncbi:MAG: xanthine dehydrogenase [Deltaproteobacteria bacterium CG11_big_fil_rev_8_21_14_0_20_49_13]|nr:MAG: xanthine dehydrogenase [Deltaproteobacteria bacterium CG11_big_fil_rev_8_21_14_0_20_49_13]